MSVSTLILNSSNIVNLNNGNNQLVFQFPNSVRLSNHALAVSNVSMYYSWYSISASQLNNVFSYYWSTDGVTYTEYSVTLPDGTYNISDINAFLQSQMLINNQYAIDASGNYVYYLTLVVNATQYKIDATSYQVPVSFPSGWTGPLVITPPSAPFNPYFVFPAQFNNIVGFSANTPIPANYSPTQSIIQIGSSVAPQVNPNPTLFLTCSGIQNPYTIPSSIIYSITPNANVGEQITFTPPQLIFNKILEGTYDRLTLTWLGSNLQPITIQDPNMTITLEIRNTQQDLGQMANALLGTTK